MLSGAERTSLRTPSPWWQTGKTVERQDNWREDCVDNYIPAGSGCSQSLGNVCAGPNPPHSIVRGVCMGSPDVSTADSYWYQFFVNTLLCDRLFAGTWLANLAGMGVA